MYGIQFCVILTLIFFKLIKCFENRHTQPLILNGEYAKIDDFPHSVYIYIKCLGYWGCGSSILNQIILLTAAHCVQRCHSGEKIHAYAGHENVNKAMVTRRGKKILIHEYFNRDPDLIYDIGLIFLEESLPLGNTIKRVILNKQNSVGLTAMVAGWGLINEQPKERTTILRSAKQIVRHLNTCVIRKQNLPGLTCAGSTNMNMQRPSTGDSGSALVTENYKQIGIVSFAYVFHPSLTFYTNTSYHYDWIKEKSRLLLNCKINNARNKIRNYTN